MKLESGIIENNFFELFYRDNELRNLEKWIYETHELKKLLSDNDYLELISLDYGKKSTKYEIYKIMGKYIDYGKFEKKNLLSMLHKALNSKNDLPKILSSFYYMYCDGYSFLRDLGLGYGLMCVVPPSKYQVETWEELSEMQKTKIMNSFYPQIKNDLIRAIGWFENDRIIFSGKNNEFNRYEYIDNRTEEEKKSTVWKDVPEGKTKKWWQFWK